MADKKPAPPSPDKDGAGSNGKKGKSNKKKPFIILGVVLVVLIGGGAAAFFMLSGGKNPRHPEVAVAPPPGEIKQYEFPKILADLKTGECRSNFLSLRFFVEVGANHTQAIREKQTKLVESVQLHLRSLERQDLVGKEGAERLRVDLARIIDLAIRPAQVKGVVFKEFILQ